MAEEAGRAAAAAARAPSARYLGMGTPGGMCGRSGEAWDVSAGGVFTAENTVNTVGVVCEYSSVNRYINVTGSQAEPPGRCMC